MFSSRVTRGNGTQTDFLIDLGNYFCNKVNIYLSKSSFATIVFVREIDRTTVMIWGEFPDPGAIGFPRTLSNLQYPAICPVHTLSRESAL